MNYKFIEKIIRECINRTMLKKSYFISVITDNFIHIEYNIIAATETRNDYIKKKFDKNLCECNRMNVLYQCYCFEYIRVILFRSNWYNTIK